MQRHNMTIASDHCADQTGSRLQSLCRWAAFASNPSSTVGSVFRGKICQIQNGCHELWHPFEHEEKPKLQIEHELENKARLLTRVSSHPPIDEGAGPPSIGSATYHQAAIAAEGGFEVAVAPTDHVGVDQIGSGAEACGETVAIGGGRAGQHDAGTGAKGCASLAAGVEPRMIGGGGAGPTGGGITFDASLRGPAGPAGRRRRIRNLVSTALVPSFLRSAWCRASPSFHLSYRKAVEMLPCLDTDHQCHVSSWEGGAAPSRSYAHTPTASVGTRGFAAFSAALPT